jgi:dienelactone hydrolase
MVAIAACGGAPTQQATPTPVTAEAVEPSPIESLRAYLAIDRATRRPLADQPFASVALTKPQAEEARRLLWDDHAAQIRATRADEIEQLVLHDGEHTMKLFYKVFGDKPATGRSLFISMHGGGKTTPEANDKQWENQKKLYTPAEGVYVAPRAPTNTSALWHEAHIDRMFDRLIEDLIVLEDVNPNRVYLMGYSAGGDGAYQLAPRMADRWAAAAMMAGHPNNASPVGLRNTPFTGHMGGLDSAFNRNKVILDWGKQLDELQAADPDGYKHLIKVHDGKPHWMDKLDAEAVPWMAAFTRDPLPRRVVWRQDEITHGRFYWLAADAKAAKLGDEVTATYDGQRITIRATGVTRLTIRANDRMMDLDKPVSVMAGTQQIYAAIPVRTIATIAKTLAERGDPTSVFSAEWTVDLPGSAAK